MAAAAISPTRGRMQGIDQNMGRYSYMLPSGNDSASPTSCAAARMRLGLSRASHTSV